MVKHLVVGGNGFIGRKLVCALHDLGQDVAVFDRFSREPDFGGRRVRVLRGDFLNEANLKDAVRGSDYVSHFLSLTTPMSSNSDATVDVRLNVIQTVRLLEICAGAGIARIFFASSGGAIYGRGNAPHSELDPTAPLSPYGIGKLAIENYLRYFHETRDLSFVSLRISNPYGAGQPRGRSQGLIPIALQNVIESKPVVKLGDGSMARDYIYLDDLIERICQVIMGDPLHEIYNIATGISTTVNEVFDVIERVTKRRLSIVSQPAPATFVDRVELNTERFDTEFPGSKPTSLADGIAATWAQMHG